jgi:hypothetical protein
MTQGHLLVVDQHQIVTALGRVTCQTLPTLTSANQSGFSMPGMENRYWLAYS